MARPKKYPDELVARGVRLALESGRPIAHVAADLGRGGGLAGAHGSYLTLHLDELGLGVVAVDGGVDALPLTRSREHSPARMLS